MKAIVDKSLWAACGPRWAHRSVPAHRVGRCRGDGIDVPRWEARAALADTRSVPWFGGA